MTARKDPFTILELGSGTGVVAANLSTILAPDCERESKVLSDSDAMHGIDDLHQTHWI